jgi:hypothetical protein
MFSKSLSTSHSIGLSILSSVLSLGYVFQDRIKSNTVLDKIPPTQDSQKACHAAMMEWWPTQ